MSANRNVPPAPSVGDAIRNLGGDAPPESLLTPEQFTPESGPVTPRPLAEVESGTGNRSGGWDSAGNGFSLGSGFEVDEFAPAETVFVPVPPPEPVMLPSQIAFAPTTNTPDAASYRAADNGDADPSPGSMPSTGASRLPTHSVAAGLAAMGLRSRAGSIAEPAYVPEPPAPPMFAHFDPEPLPVAPLPPVAPAPVPAAPLPVPPAAAAPVSVPPAAAAPVSVPPAAAAPVSVPPAAAAPVPVAPAALAPVPVAPVTFVPVPPVPTIPPLTPPASGSVDAGSAASVHSGPVSAPPAYARPENIEPEYTDEPEAPEPAEPEPEHVMPPLGPAGVYTPALAVASVLPGGHKLPPVPAPEFTEPEYASPSAPEYEYTPDVYEAEDPREALRSSTRRAVDRLTRGVPTSARLDPAQGHDHNLPRIVELTMQVERAIIGAAAAERFQREIEQTAREAAAEIISTAAADAHRALENATAESQSVVAGARAEAEKLLSDSLAESSKVLSDADAEREAIIARAESQARATVAQAEIELDRRLRRIAALTDEIVDIAESAVERTGAGMMNGQQIAQFIGALSTVTERALEHLEQANQTGTTPNPHVTDDRDVSAEDEIES